jgi:hypothetical protein
MTYFTSLSYTNYSMVTDWYVAGNEIADHSFEGRATHRSVGEEVVHDFGGIELYRIVRRKGKELPDCLVRDPPSLASLAQN